MSLDERGRDRSPGSSSGHFEQAARSALYATTSKSFGSGYSRLPSSDIASVHLYNQPSNVSTEQTVAMSKSMDEHVDVVEDETRV